MRTFKIGDRVRITGPGNMHGRTGTVWDIQTPRGWRWPWEDRRPKWAQQAIDYGVHPKETCYLVDVDGHGKRCNSFSFDHLGYPYYWLAPLVDPAADAFIAQVKRWKP